MPNVAAPFVRAAKERLLERGIIQQPDLIVVADDSLVAIPAAGVVAGVDQHSVLLINSHTDADTWRNRLNYQGGIVTLPAAEDTAVRLPVLVNMDGFYLSFTREPVEIPTAERVKTFLPPFDPGRLRFKASTPESHAVAVLGGGPYSYFRYETHLAACKALEVYPRIAAEFEALFGRRQPMVETAHCEDAEFVFVMMGSFATKAEAAVESLRAAGWKIGLVRPRLLRPFPREQLQRLLGGRRAA